MKSIDDLDVEQAKRLRPRDVVKMDRNCSVSVIQCVAFAITTGNSHFPATKVWEKAPIEHIVKDVDGVPHCFNLTSA